jgi:predicted MFS family arabinose efflux permease
LIAQVFGAVSGVLVDALSFGVSALCLRSLSTSGHKPVVVGRRLRSEIAEGMRFLAGDPYLRVLTCFGAVSNIALTGSTSIAVLFLVRDIGTSPGTAGLLMSFGGVGGVCGALLAGTLARRFGTARAMVLSEVIAAPFLLLPGLTQAGFGLLFFVAGLFAICLGVCVSNIQAATFRQQYCPPELRGRVNASGSVVNYGTIPLGALLGGALGSGLGVRETLLLMGGLQILSTGILLASPLRRLRDFPTAAERSPLRLPQPR